jgi:hypothetical protein
LTIGAGALDDPNDDDLRNALGQAQGRLKNFTCMGHLDLRPSGPLVIGLAYRRLATTYSTGEFIDNHYNLAVGFRF